MVSARRRTWTSYIVYRKAAALLQEAGVRVHRPYVGEYVTSLEMAGVSVTVIKLDDELKHLVDASADTPMFTQLYRSAGGVDFGDVGRIAGGVVHTLPEVAGN